MIKVSITILHFTLEDEIFWNRAINDYSGRYSQHYGLYITKSDLNDYVHVGRRSTVVEFVGNITVIQSWTKEGVTIVHPINSAAPYNTSGNEHNDSSTNSLQKESV